ncbi:MAG: hypothetical protein EA422_02345 [Gemmatimonadales bacterium]|nr:MAG: hypothetical protein EA422_02345 [Gemmatimonadales bacterium]
MRLIGRFVQQAGSRPAGAHPHGTVASALRPPPHERPGPRLPRSSMIPHPICVYALLVMGVGAIPTSASSQTDSAASSRPDSIRIVQDLDSAPRPEAIIRRASGPIQIDGVLDDPAWEVAQVISEFVQNRPREGYPVSERTEVRLLFDDDYLYIGAELFDSDPSGIISPTLERDPNTRDGDALGILFDTFLDRSTGFAFYVNPGGAVRDGQVSDDGRNANFAWDGAFEVRTRIHQEGWTVEMAIPFSTLRFDPGRMDQSWGLNLLRRIRRKNEDAVWAPMDRQWALHTPSRAGTLTGLEGIRAGRNLTVKPYALSTRPSGQLVDPLDRSLDWDTGVDLKYGITSGLTLDLTLNTDFSQVEVDQQQVNLTRFSLFFPERRDFFLENEGIFTFGDNSSFGERAGVSRQDFTLFHSRRIGLTATGDPLPILGGGRVSGTVGGAEVGLLSMRTRDAVDGTIPGESFSVGRIRLRPVPGLDVGAMAVQRSTMRASTQINRSYGVDANYQMGSHLLVQSYLAGTQGTGLDRDRAGRLSARWRSPLVEAMVLYRSIGDEFTPGVGFVRRRGIRHGYGTLGFTPRIPWPLVQQLNPYVQAHRFTNRDGVLETGTVTLGLDVDFRDGSEAGVLVREQREWIQSPFSLRGVTVEPGNYTFQEVEGTVQSSRARPFSTSLRAAGGGFFSGERLSLGWGILWRPSAHLLLRGEADRNRIEIPGAGALTANIYSVRAQVIPSTRLMTGAFIQYNGATEELISNLRLNWIHAPLSDLFLVWTERRDMASGMTLERGVSLKVTRLVSF